ncbi:MULTISPECIES: MGDG synthase family glycosyltransferase [unclassified Sedimentibacter]|uniref:MGDG synthase family glycosyltransferase n=1 Tax=unclassified Sedimentibacter TaxID=2649220 RepID=UPI0027E0F1C2|nr:glycosyltransferase [Sedimentibacter sp. MB35-C1]WMJ78345.1 glycosyltransferase [Sedimentibacter sp. MB35-C1]
MNLNILITTAPFGNGHKMVATALKNAFINKGYNNVFIVDLFTEAHPKITETIKKAYIRSYEFGEAYSILYYGSEKLTDKKVIELYRNFGYKKLNEIASQFKPDVIINTFPILASLRIKNQLGENIPVFNIVTDFYAHKLWLSEEIDKFYIATEELQEELKKLNIPVEKTVVSGIPIRDAFEEAESISMLYKKYNFKRGKKIVLINSGAFGVFKNIKKVCVELCKNKMIQVAVVCGNNKIQKAKLESLGLRNLKVFGFIENIDDLYKISCCMITKSGGITLSEALAVQIPLIIIKPVPGQEKENALYFEKKGAAIIANNSYQIIDSTIELIKNPSLLNAMKKNMKKMHTKASSIKIVDDVVESIEK